MVAYNHSIGQYFFRSAIYVSIILICRGLVCQIYKKSILKWTGSPANTLDPETSLLSYMDNTNVKQVTCVPTKPRDPLFKGW